LKKGKGVRCKRQMLSKYLPMSLVRNEREKILNKKKEGSK
jgi:hypothetical protein